MEVMELLLHFLFHFLLLLHLSSSSSSSSSIHPSALDPKQLTALQSMGLPVGADPCSPSRNSTTTCDSSAPFRHLVSLSLADCSPELDISFTALRSLSTLVSLSFSRCPDLLLARHPLPLPLASSLRSFSCSHSLKRLPGVWLSRLHNLTSLSVLSVPVSAASGPVVFLSQMPYLLSASVSSANLSGRVPHHWHSLNLSHLDLSNNSLSGALPASLASLSNLQLLNLSSNSLSGTLPDSLADLIYLQSLSLSRNSLSGPVPDAMSALPQLAHLDLGSNRLNGSVPRFLADMPGLVYLNLENNDFRGAIPFNGSFVKRMEVFRTGGNTNLCYNKSLISPKAAAAAKLGIAACDRHGMPLSPPPDRSSRDSGYSDGGEDEDGDGGGGGDGDGGGKGGRSARAGGGGGGGGGGHHGPSTLVLGVGIALACLVFLVIFVVCLSKICG